MMLIVLAAASAAANTINLIDDEKTQNKLKKLDFNAADPDVIKHIRL